MENRVQDQLHSAICRGGTKNQSCGVIDARMTLTYPQVPVKERRRYAGSLQDVSDLFLHRSEALQDVLGVGVALHQSGAAVSLVLRVSLLCFFEESNNYRRRFSVSPQLLIGIRRVITYSM